MTSSTVYECGEQTAKSITAPAPETGRRSKQGPRPEGGTKNRANATVASKKAPKIYLPRCIFFLHAGATLVSFECEFASPQRRERRSFRRTRVKIEFFIPSCPPAFPFHLHSEKKSCQTNALAPCSCHVLHGVWRNIRHRGDHSRRRLWPRNSDSAVP